MRRYPVTAGLTGEFERLFPVWKSIRHGSAVQTKTEDDGHDRESFVSMGSIRRRNHRQLISFAMFFRPVFHYPVISEFPE